jgi:nucleotide-binding universal stress UspA family protein
MRGFGGDGPRRRTATLRSYRPLDERTGQAELPTTYRELLEDVYANVGLSVAARTQLDAAGEAVTTDVDDSRSLGFLRLRRWDAEARAALHASVRHLLSRHVDVVYGDLDLVTVDALDDIADWEGKPIAPPPELVGLLAEARDEVEGHGLQAEFMWAAGEPGNAIVEAARDAKVDAVVLGEHHHSFLAGLFGSDVAAAVERELGSAVIVA